MPDQELDEFGIPIKKVSAVAEKVQTDEFGIPLKKKGGTQPSSEFLQTSANGGVNTSQSKLQSQSPLQPKEQTYDGLLGTAIKRGQEIGGNMKNVVPSYETPNNASESTSNADANRQRDLVEKVIPLANAEKAKSDLAVKEFSKKRLKASNIPEQDDYLSTEEATVRRRIADGDLGFHKNSKGEFEIKRTDGYGAGLVKTLTAPFETFINTVNATEDRNISNNYLASLPKNKAIEYLNLKIANPEAFDKSPESVPQNNVGGIGAKFLGENINLLLKGTVGAIAGTALAPETGGASFGQFLTTAKDVTNGAYASALESNYRKAKVQNPNLTDEEAYDMAEKTALVSGATALATNAALAGSISGKLPSPKVPVNGVVNGIKASLKHAIKTSPKSVGLAAGGSLATDATANLVGIDVPLGEAVKNASEHAKGMAIMHFGMWGMTEPTKIPSYIRPQIENVVASAPREEVAKIYSDAESQGILPQGTTEKILGKLSEFDKAKAIVAPFAISEESKAAIAGKLLQKKPVEEALSALDKKAFPTKAAELEAQIEDINKDIDGIYKTNKPLSFEVDKQTGDKPTDKPLEDLKSTTVIMPKPKEEVSIPSEGEIEQKKADIEKRRKEELKQADLKAYDENTTGLKEQYKRGEVEFNHPEIDAKYDAELAALEKEQAPKSEVVSDVSEGKREVVTPEGFANRVFDKNTQLGTAPKDAHISEEGYNYRVLSPKEIEAIGESGGVFSREGKQKGGNSNTKYWTKGNGGNWYGDKETLETIRVKQDKFSEDKVVKAEDVEVYNKETKQFEPLIKESEKTTIKESNIITNEGSPTSNESKPAETQPNTAAEVDKTKPTASKTKVSQSLRDKAKAVREKGYNEAFNLPHIKLDEGTQTAGFGGKGLDNAIAKSLEIVADGIDAGKELVDSAKEGFENLKKYYAENSKRFDENKLRDEFINGIAENKQESELLREQFSKKEPPKPPIEDKPLIENKDDSNEFDKLTHTTIESKEVRETLSNAERVTGIESTDETKDFNPQERLDAIAQGEKFISKAKELFGDEYVTKFLRYLEEKRGTLSIENHSLALLSLEVDLTKQLKADPSNLSLAKQLEMVRGVVFKNQRSAARATGYGIIRDIAINGYSAREEMSNQLLTAKEREAKNKIEEALHADAKTIQKEAESKLQEKEDTITLTAAELDAKVTEAAAKLRIEERKAERVGREEKVAENLKKARQQLVNLLSVKGAENLKSQGADLNTVLDAADKLILKIWKAGETTKEIVDKAVDFVSDKLGTNEWNKEAYKKIVAAQIGVEYKTKGKESQFKQEYKALETERNRQLAVVDKLQTELTDLQKGIRKTPESKEVVKDTPEIEALKLKIKEEKAKLAVTDATIKRIAVKETELQRLQERKPQVKTERDKRILSEREVELQKQIDAEKKAIKEETIANGGGRLDKAKERVKLRMEEIREEIAAKERKAKEENKPLNGDLEYDRLLEQEASLKKLRDKYLPEEKDPFEKEKQREQVKDALVKDIVDLNEQINARERAPKKEKADYSNDEEIVKLKKLKADKQAILEEIDPAAVPREKTIAEKLKAAEIALENQNKAIEKEILSGERELKNAKKNPLQSNRLDRLRETNRMIKALRDKYLPKTKDPFEQQKAEKAARTNLTKEVIELNRQIQKGQKDILTETKSPESENLEKLMQEKRARQAILEALDPTPKLFVEQALIEKGFGKKIKVKTKTGVEERNVLDWTKLTGEERNIENISRNVGEVLQDKGFTEEQGLRIQDKFIDEYNRLSADVLEKSQNRLAALNNKVVTSEQRSAGQKLAELYNLGLFEKDPAQLEYLLSRAIGTSEISIDRFNQVKDLANAFNEIHKAKLDGKLLLDISKGTIDNIIEQSMQSVLRSQFKDKGGWALAATDNLKILMDLNQRMGLNTLKQAVNNSLSGFQQDIMSSIGSLTDVGSIPKEIKAQMSSNRRAVLKNMILNGEVGFGESSSQFVNKSNIDSKLKSMTDSQVFHTIASVYTGRAILDGMDSFYKTKMTNVKFYQSLFKILTKDRLVDGVVEKGMSKKEAQNYIVEKMTGQSYDKSVVTAKELIAKVNEAAGKKLVGDNPLFVERLANDIVKTALVEQNVITADMVTKSYNASYKLAGRSLGHETNNIITDGIRKVGGTLEKSYNDAVKEKNYNSAASIQLTNILYKNFMTKYAAGAANWTILTLENNGLGLLSSLYNTSGKAEFDLLSESGVANLEKALFYEGKKRDAFVRGLVGSVTAAALTGAVAGTVGVDDYRKWRGKNQWLAKYTDNLNPMMLSAIMAWRNSQTKSNENFGDFVGNAIGSNSRYEKAPVLLKNLNEATKGKGEKVGQTVGEIIGAGFDTPIPWRLVRDGENIWLGANGKEVYKVPKTKKGQESLWNGLSKAGFLDYLFSNPLSKK